MTKSPNNTDNCEVKHKLTSVIILLTVSYINSHFPPGYRAPKWWWIDDFVWFRGRSDVAGRHIIAIREKWKPQNYRRSATYEWRDTIVSSERNFRAKVPDLSTYRVLKRSQRSVLLFYFVDRGSAGQLQLSHAWSWSRHGRGHAQLFLINLYP